MGSVPCMNGWFECVSVCFCLHSMGAAQFILSGGEDVRVRGPGSGVTAGERVTRDGSGHPSTASTARYIAGSRAPRCFPDSDSVFLF